MSDLSTRIKNLSPEQQQLLQRRMEQRDMKPPELQVSRPELPLQPLKNSSLRHHVDLSIFFFSADGVSENEDRYRLLIESARLADREGFRAIWTPERHFQTFGGLYPNPSVLSAALAMITEQIQIRAGSVVLPLHSPVRVAEEWALVDNLSQGRVGISIATGWHEDDYVIAPGNYETRRELMFRNIGIIRRLWAGEEVELPGINGKQTRVRSLPRPVQPHLPVWVTVSSERSWRSAGEIGANVLTALGGVSLESLSQSIAAYRKARQEHGHDPRTGIVSLMLHTFLGTDNDVVRSQVRGPLKKYLQSYMDQFKNLSGEEKKNGFSANPEELLDLAVENYFQNASLLGTPEKCAAMIEQIGAAGVNEAACLVDFGFDFESTMESLSLLADLRKSLVRETSLATTPK
jgi:natural product biosynthesis luciferase-like monooxygenase protein